MRPARYLLLLGAAVSAAAPIPAPVVVEEPVEVPEGLVLGPGFAPVEVADDGALVTHHLSVGGGERVTFDLAVRTVERGADGVPRLGAASDAIRLPAGEVVLDPGERATIVSAVSGDAGVPAVHAVTATPRLADAEPLVGFVLSVPPGSGEVGAPSVDAVLISEDVSVHVTGPGDHHTVADVRVRFGPLVGPALIDETLRDLLLWPGEVRILTWQLDLPPLPVPYRIEVVAGSPDGAQARTTVTSWPPAGEWLPAVAAVLVVVTALLWLVLRRRR